MNHQSFSKRYVNWLWLLEAKNKYLESFSLFNISNINLNTEDYIGVYGPTQVGKTTFILTLLGIKQEEMSPLSNALRGGQNKGQSATVTATVFKKSEDSNFYIIKNTSEDLPVRVKAKDLKELENELAIVREEITKRKVISLTEITIYIPLSYFLKKGKKEKELIIVDLPGDDTKDESEEGHVDSIINKYLNLCKCIIIMELSSNVTGISQISLNSIKEWYKYPNKFIVVITRAISDASVNKEVLKKEIASAEDLLIHYKEEIERIIREGDTDNFVNGVYPLELGDSLKSLENNMGKHLYGKVNNWNNSILKELRIHLEEIDAPEFQVKQLFNITSVITQAKKDDLNSIERKEKELEKYIDNLKVENYKLRGVMGLDNEKEGLMKVMNEILYNIHKVTFIKSSNVFQSNDSNIKKLETKELGGFNFTSEDLLSFPKDLEFDPKNAKYDTVNNEYFNYLNSVKKEITSQLNDMSKDFKKSFILKSEFKFPNSREILKKLTRFEELNVKKSLITKKVKENPYSERIDDLKEQLIEAISYDLDRLLWLGKKRKQIYQGLIEENQKNLQQIEREIDENVYRLEQLKEKKREANNIWEKDIEQSKRLNNFFVNEYRNEMQLLIKQYNSLQKEDERIVIGTQMNIITYQLERLVVYGRERDK